MLISTQKRFIAFSFNKTASTSLEASLTPYGDEPLLQIVEELYRQTGTLRAFKHARPLAIQKIIGEMLWSQFFTFCFVRNPFDRLVSLYHFHREKLPDAHPEAVALNFTDWLKRGGTGSASRSMREFVTDNQGQQIIDFVGRFENLREDAAELGHRIGVSIDLPHLNSTNRRSYQEYYDDAAIRAAKKLVKEDLDYFKYQF